MYILLTEWAYFATNKSHSFLLINFYNCKSKHVFFPHVSNDNNNECIKNWDFYLYKFIKIVYDIHIYNPYIWTHLCMWWLYLNRANRPDWSHQLVLPNTIQFDIWPFNPIIHPSNLLLLSHHVFFLAINTQSHLILFFILQ